MSKTHFIHPAVQSVLNQGLYVAYGATPEPQALEIEVDLGAAGNIADPVMSLLVVLDEINCGVAGSDVFEPSLGKASIKAGPKKAPKDPVGPIVRWTLEVAGVAPIYLRLMVRHLAMGFGYGNWARAVRIHGAAAPTVGQPTADTNTVAKWLVDPDAYPVAWPKVPFPIRSGKAKRSAGRVAATPSAALKPKELQAFEYAMLTAGGVASVTTSADLQEEPEVGLAQIASNKKQVVSTWQPFDAARAPAHAAMTNALVRFHSKTRALLEAEISLP